MKNILIIFSFCIWVNLLYAETYTLRIPKISQERATRLKDSKIFNPQDWNGAAVINKFNAVGNRKVPEETVFFLMHDGKNLYVATRCKGTSGKAFKRQSDDILINDEAVQVVLGLGSKMSTEIAVGGYDGSYAVKEPVAHFYEFTVNMAGAISRTYNETPLANPRFEAQVYRRNDSWYALMCIPFSSIGVNNEFKDEQHMRFNAFRFHEAERYGWSLGHFGNYHSLPFVQAIFLKDDANPSVDGAWTGPAEQIKKKQGAKFSADLKKPKAKFSTDLKKLKIDYYHLMRVVAAKLPPDTSGRTLILVRNDGEEVRKKLNFSQSSSIKMTIPKDWEADKNFSVSLFLEKAGGQKELLTKADFNVKPTPKWVDSRTAMEYLDSKVPYPWNKPEWKNNELHLSHAKIEYGQDMLPRQITVKGIEILRAPIQITAVINGRKLPVNQQNRVRTLPTCVELESTEKSGIELKSMIDFDGFISTRCRVKGNSASNLEKLELRIPLAAGVAETLIYGGTQNFFKVSEFGWTGNAISAMWFGNVNCGINFTFDRSPFRSPNDGKKAELKVNSDGTSDLVFHFITRKGQENNPDTVYQFYLQPTPVRANPVPPQYDQMDMVFQQWSDFQAYPDLKKIPELKAAAEKSRAKGNNFYVYFGHLVAADAPYYKEYPDELFASNRSMIFQRSFNPGKNVPCYLSCMRSPAAELLLDGVEQLVAKAGISGVYLDGPTVPFSCDNPLHDCSDVIPVDWNDSWQAGRIAGQRAFVKRLRGIFDSRGIKAPLWAHTGGGFSISTLGLCDFYYDGEHLQRYRHGYLLEPDRFAMCYSGKPFGFRGIFLPVHYISADVSTRQGLPWSLPHDADNGICPYPAHPAQRAFQAVLTRDPEAKFYGGWAEQEHIKVLSGDTTIGYWLGSQEATLAASNLKYSGTQEVAVNIADMFPGENLKVTALHAPDNSSYKDGILSFKVPSSEVRLFHITPVKNDGEFPLPEVQSKIISSEKSASNDMKPVSIKEKDIAAMAEALPKNFILEAELNHSGAFKLHIDNMVFTNDVEGGWNISGLNEFNHSVRSDVSLAPHGRKYTRRNQKIKLLIAVQNDLVSVYYDDVMVLKNGLPAKIHNVHKIEVELLNSGNHVGLKPVKLLPGLHPEIMPVQTQPVL